MINNIIEIKSEMAIIKSLSIKSYYLQEWNDFLNSRYKYLKKIWSANKKTQTRKMGEPYPGEENAA